MGISQLIVVALDVRGSHEHNPDCPMRIAQHPGGYWYCVDCGYPITAKRIVANTEGGWLEKSEKPCHD